MLLGLSSIASSLSTALQAALTLVPNNHLSAPRCSGKRDMKGGVPTVTPQALQKHLPVHSTSDAIGDSSPAFGPAAVAIGRRNTFPWKGATDRKGALPGVTSLGLE
eukprot:6620797-Pyramimonas_sp.AAC.1